MLVFNTAAGNYVLKNWYFHRVLLKMFRGYEPSPRANCRFNHVVEAKRFEVCSYVEKYAEFENQTLINIRWYTNCLYAKEYHRGDPYYK